MYVHTRTIQKQNNHTQHNDLFKNKTFKNQMFVKCLISEQIKIFCTKCLCVKYKFFKTHNT